MRPKKIASAGARTMQLAPPVALAPWPTVPPPAEPESFIIQLPMAPRPRPLGGWAAVWTLMLAVTLLVGGTSWTPRFDRAQARARVQGWIASTRTAVAQARARVVRRVAALHAPFGQEPEPVAVAAVVVAEAPKAAPAPPAKSTARKKHVPHRAPAHKKAHRGSRR